MCWEVYVPCLLLHLVDNYAYLNQYIVYVLMCVQVHMCVQCTHTCIPIEAIGQPQLLFLRYCSPGFRDRVFYAFGVH